MDRLAGSGPFNDFTNNWNSTYAVGQGYNYSTIEEAVIALYAATGSAAFAEEAVIYVMDQSYDQDVNSETAVTFEDAVGVQLVSCVVAGNTDIASCTNAKILGCTFDYSDTGTQRLLTITNSANLAVTNNIFLNNGVTSGLCFDTQPAGGYNCYYPTNSPVGALMQNEVNSICPASFSLASDYTLSYTYDAAGRLQTFADSSDSGNDVTNTYDHLGRRIAMEIGGVEKYRFVYDIQNVNESVGEKHGKIQRIDKKSLTLTA